MWTTVDYVFFNYGVGQEKKKDIVIHIKWLWKDFQSFPPDLSGNDQTSLAQNRGWEALERWVEIGKSQDSRGKVKDVML